MRTRHTTHNGTLVIWADDLSGAANAVAPFGARGWSTLIKTLEANCSYDTNSYCDTSARIPDPGTVVCFDVDARGGGVDSIPELPRPEVLKIDSLGRGPIPELIAEVTRRFSFGSVILAPAWPTQSRGVRAGSDRYPIDWPKITASAADLSRLPVTLSEASTPSALATIVQRAPADALLVGSQGLTAAIADVVQHPAEPRPSTAVSPPVSGMPVLRSPRSDASRSGSGMLVVLGSCEELAQKQLHQLRTAGWAELHLTPDGVLPTAEAALLSLSADRGVVCAVSARSAVEWGETFESNAEELATLCAAAGCIAASGGATAEQVLSAMRASVLHDTVEDTRGLSISRLQDGRMFITQPGSVGQPGDFLSFAIEHRAINSEMRERST